MGSHKFNDGDASQLHDAVIRGDVEPARLLLEAGNIPNVEDNRGRTPLHLAVSNQDLDLVKLLLAVGADPNVQNRQGNTSLHEAVNLEQSLIRRVFGVFGDIRIQFADALVKGGANSCVGNNQDVSPLDLAEESGNGRLINLLTEVCLNTIAKLPPTCDEGSGNTGEARGVEQAPPRGKSTSLNEVLAVV